MKFKGNLFKYRALLVQRRLTHYRVPFFNQLREQLRENNCELILAYGRPALIELNKNDSADLDWAVKLQTRYFYGGQVCWQPFGKLAATADMIIVTQENKLVYNLYQQILNKNARLGLWGHGGNFQGNSVSLRERFKRMTSRKADWWFGYTDISKPHIMNTGFPENRITIVNNSIDTNRLKLLFDNIKAADLVKHRNSLGLQGECVGVYVGSLYAEKRIDFMLKAVLEIRKAVPSFEFLVVGSGPDEDMVRNFCEKYRWARYFGALKDQAKANVLALAKIIINPGLVGLGILDSFVSGVPMVTTNCGLHSPEICYLENGINGTITPNSIEQYAGAVIALLKDDKRRAELVIGCNESAKKYTIENMAARFSHGIIRCLEEPSYR